MKFILASESPRRRFLLAQAGIICESVSSGADESSPAGQPPEKLVAELAGRKADAALALRNWERPALIIAADTVVYIDGKILGKPANREEAAEMLEKLQGRTHTVYTGVAIKFLRDNIIEETGFVETARVTMRSLSPKEIARYVSTGEPDDKAGAYGVQGLGSVLIKRVEGDYHTVVGLPLARLCEALKDWRIDYMAGWDGQ